MKSRDFRYIRISIISVLIILVSAAGIILHPYIVKIPDNIFRSAPAGETIDAINEYNIYVDFKPEEKTLSCVQSIKYRSTVQKPLTHIYFHLYPNAFKYESKPAFPMEEMDRAYPNGFSEGYIDIDNIIVEGNEADYTISGYSDGLLTVFLNEPLEPDKSITIEMEYTVVMPNCMGRFGYGDKTWKAANWYPIAAVYDDKGWALDPYYPIGDPFYSEISDYTVIIKAPNQYVIASTGTDMSCTQKGSYKEWEFKAPSVRDFAWVASPDFNTISKRVGDTTVISYYYTDEYGEKALDYAADALKIFNDKFGLYPYKRLSVVESDFFIGGMEYPNLVMIDTNIYSEKYLGWLEMVTVHEIAHQWWYGVVGNDQVNEAWLDEGLTEYSAVLYYGARYGPDKEKYIYSNMIAEGKYSALQEYVKESEVINRPIHEFKNWIEYDILVYGKGAMMFHEMRNILGDKVFLNALREYYKKYKYKNVKAEDMIETFSEVSGRNLWDVFDKWLNDGENSKDPDKR